jgi:hypothetical protein
LINLKLFQINNDIWRAETLPAAMYVESAWRDRSHYSPERETGMHHFHQLLAQFVSEN